MRGATRGPDLPPKMVGDTQMSDPDADTRAQAQLDRAYDVLERCRDCGVAPADLTDEAVVLADAEASPALRSVVASLASELGGVTWHALVVPGQPEKPQASRVDGAVGAVKAACAAGGAGLDAACLALLRAVDPDGAAHVPADRVEVLGAWPDVWRRLKAPRRRALLSPT